LKYNALYSTFERVDAGGLVIVSSGVHELVFVKEVISDFVISFFFETVVHQRASFVRVLVFV
jgi:hypothetical protein